MGTGGSVREKPSFVERSTSAPAYRKAKSSQERKSKSPPHRSHTERSGLKAKRRRKKRRQYTQTPQSSRHQFERDGRKARESYVRRPAKHVRTKRRKLQNRKRPSEPLGFDVNTLLHQRAVYTNDIYVDTIQENRKTTWEDFEDRAENRKSTWHVGDHEDHLENRKATWGHSNEYHERQYSDYTVQSRGRPDPRRGSNSEPRDNRRRSAPTNRGLSPEMQPEQNIRPTVVTRKRAQSQNIHPNVNHHQENYWSSSRQKKMQTREAGVDFKTKENHLRVSEPSSTQRVARIRNKSYDAGDAPINFNKSCRTDSSVYTEDLSIHSTPHIFIGGQKRWRGSAARTSDTDALSLKYAESVPAIQSSYHNGKRTPVVASEDYQIGPYHQHNEKKKDMFKKSSKKLGFSDSLSKRFVRSPKRLAKKNLSESAAFVMLKPSFYFHPETQPDTSVESFDVVHAVHEEWIEQFQIKKENRKARLSIPARQPPNRLRKPSPKLSPKPSPRESARKVQLSRPNSIQKRHSKDKKAKKLHHIRQITDDSAIQDIMLDMSERESIFCGFLDMHDFSTEYRPDELAIIESDESDYNEFNERFEGSIPEHACTRESTPFEQWVPFETGSNYSISQLDEGSEVVTTTDSREDNDRNEDSSTTESATQRREEADIVDAEADNSSVMLDEKDFMSSASAGGGDLDDYDSDTESEESFQPEARERLAERVSSSEEWAGDLGGGDATGVLGDDLSEEETIEEDSSGESVRIHVDSVRRPIGVRKQKSEKRRLSDAIAEARRHSDALRRQSDALRRHSDAMRRLSDAIRRHSAYQEDTLSKGALSSSFMESTVESKGIPPSRLFDLADNVFEDAGYDHDSTDGFESEETSSFIEKIPPGQFEPKSGEFSSVNFSYADVITTIPESPTDMETEEEFTSEESSRSRSRRKDRESHSIHSKEPRKRFIRAKHKAMRKQKQNQEEVKEHKREEPVKERRFHHQQHSKSSRKSSNTQKRVRENFRKEPVAEPDIQVKKKRLSAHYRKRISDPSRTKHKLNNVKEKNRILVFFSDFFNDVFGSNAVLSYLMPLASQGRDLLMKLQDGILLCFFCNYICNDLIDFRAVNYDPTGLNYEDCMENLVLAVQATKSIGITGATPEQIYFSHLHPQACINFLWSLLDYHLHQTRSVKRTKPHNLLPYMHANNELSIQDRVQNRKWNNRSAAAADVLKWANKRVSKLGQRPLRDFYDTRLSDGTFFIYLLATIAPKLVDLSVLKQVEHFNDAISNASYAISISRKLGVTTFITPEDIVGEDEMKIFAFCASLMQHCLFETTT